MKKIKSWVWVAGIFAFLVVFMFGQKVFGNMAVQSKESAEEKVELGEEKMEEAVTGGDTAKESVESVEEKTAYVDEKMSEALASDGYSKMSLAERRELASDILKQLEQDGYITGLSYDEDSLLYSFEYMDGTLGGWRIEDFSAQDGLLPMN